MVHQFWVEWIDAPGARAHTAPGAAAAAVHAGGPLEDVPGQQQHQHQQQGATDGGSDAPLADYALEALWGLAEAAKQGAMDVGFDAGREGVAAVLYTAAALYEKLDGMQLRRREVLDSMHAIADSVRLPRVVAAGEGGVEYSRAAEDSRCILDILEITCAIGEGRRVESATAGALAHCQGTGVCYLTGGSRARTAAYRWISTLYGTVRHRVWVCPMARR